jgi:hypothetical protein
LVVIEKNPRPLSFTPGKRRDRRRLIRIAMKATMSATVNAVSEPGASVLPAEPGDCAARRSRLASVGLVLILLGASVFAVWSSQATSR